MLSKRSDAMEFSSFRFFCCAFDDSTSTMYLISSSDMCLEFAIKETVCCYLETNIDKIRQLQASCDKESAFL